MKRTFVWDPKSETLVEVTKRPTTVHKNAKWPMKSLALSVHPADAKAANKLMRDCQIEGVRYGKDGVPTLTSRKARREATLAFQGFDRDGGYGDAQPGDSQRFLEKRYAGWNRLRP